jgi:putative phosphoribosyl transferase
MPETGDRDTATTAVRIQQLITEPEVAFRDRSDAGHALAEFVSPAPDPTALVLAVPRGGVPVASPLARRLGSRLDVAPVRKLPLPRWPEAGFGAVAIDGSTVLNEDLVQAYRLPISVIEQIKAETLDEVRRRAVAYRGTAEPPVCQCRDVVLVDDGLASGYTMLAAARMARENGAKSVTVCVPVSPRSSIERVKGVADKVWCLMAQEEAGFAVASFYEDFRDLSDDQVQTTLHERNTQWSIAHSGGPA